MIPCVIYARVSSKDQEEEGFSIPAQLKLFCRTPSRISSAFFVSSWKLSRQDDWAKAVRQYGGVSTNTLSVGL